MKTRCQCCDRNEELTSRKSKLQKGTSFLLCEVCAKGNHEPRFWLVLFGRANGVRAIQKQILGAQYCGNDILLREVL